MKNKEKYINLRFDDCSIMFAEVFKTHCGCKCTGCKFGNIERFIDFMNEDCVEPVRLTKNEKAILESVDKDYKWIARDGYNPLYLYKNKPHWLDNDYGWSGDGCVEFYMFDNLFNFIEAGNSKPYSIEELLKCEVVENVD